MKKSQIVTIVIVAAFIALLVAINAIEPSRVSDRQREESLEAQGQIAEAERAEAEAGEQSGFRTLREEVRAFAAQASTQAGAETPEPGDLFQVEFQCSNGTFVVEIHPEWAPYGAQRFREIIEAGIHNEARFFRVVPSYVVQWGIPGDPEAAGVWSKRTIPDEPVIVPNERGTLTYAMLSSVENSRTTQVYINLADNSRRLDHLGFAPIGKVVKGMEVVDAINAEYGQTPDQELIETRGNAYLKEYFPRLDFIKDAKILGDVSPDAPDAAEPEPEA